MKVHDCVIGVLWLTLVVGWVSSAGELKRRAGADRWIWWREIALRLGLFALLVLALRMAATAHVLPGAAPYLTAAIWPVWLTGCALCALGVALVIVARLTLERHRALPGPRERDVKLVTSGPYAMVRHPIYGGLLLAMAGSALGQSPLWLLPLVVYGPFFIRSARREEAMLMARFPDEYPAYLSRTRMLLPFVL